MLKVYLQQGKEKAIRMGHPWVFSGAVHRVEGDVSPGAVCDIVTAQGEKLGTGFYNPNSTIRVRVITRGKESFSIDQRIKDAIDLRKSILSDGTDSCRLINSEGDRLPGLIVDKFASGLCLQIQTFGMELLRKEIVDSLSKYVAPAFIVERSDTESRQREGLSSHDGLISGTLLESPVVSENNNRFRADILTGQKTGFFFDQRDNRALFSHYAKGKNIGDCFCYSGGFSLYGLKNGATHATCIDISKNATDATSATMALNEIGGDRYSCVTADVFDYLRMPGHNFDCIVLDPPKFAKHKGEVDKAARGYKDINLLACKTVKSNGIIFTFSCSQAVDTVLFRQIVFAAAADSGRTVQVLHTLSAGPDHPFTIAHREGEYLKGLVLRVL